ncbi:helix-turn-helix domain-containing protein [Paraburkholderia sp. MM5477-R1]|uniref:helix-turn-helix domain-containing protein n=1 Tax=Paraburkholderia sp. MM5477-R1 TaxID=2991062 RepID=UPI003D246869
MAAMSGSNFVRYFQRELGVSPSAYLLDLRLQVARQLLVDTGLPVDKVARRAGMSSGVHLARSFRQHMKILPTEYRAFHRDSEPPWFRPNRK